MLLFQYVIPSEAPSCVVECIAVLSKYTLLINITLFTDDRDSLHAFAIAHLVGMT